MLTFSDLQTDKIDITSPLSIHFMNLRPDRKNVHIIGNEIVLNLSYVIVIVSWFVTDIECVVAAIYHCESSHLTTWIVFIGQYTPLIFEGAVALHQVVMFFYQYVYTNAKTEIIYLYVRICAFISENATLVV